MSVVLEKTKPSGQGKYTVEKLLGIETADNLKLVEKVEAGFSFGALERVGKTARLSLEFARGKNPLHGGKFVTCGFGNVGSFER